MDVIGMFAIQKIVLLYIASGIICLENDYIFIELYLYN